MKPIPVVIPYFRAAEALKKTIQSLESQTGVSVEIFVRDNSIDNILYTKAVNEGLRKFCYQSKYDYCLVINHDVLLEPSCIKNMVDAMNTHSRLGICAPLSLERNGAAANWAGSLNAWPAGNSISDDIKNVPSSLYETYWINGACMLLRIEMVREIGLLDENMKFICSDSDYSFTARSRGFIVGVEPSAKIFHELSGSANQDPENPINLIKWQDMLYFARKWILGDLFKCYSYEGQQLTPAFIERNVNAAIEHIDEYKEFFSKNPPSEDFDLDLLI